MEEEVSGESDSDEYEEILELDTCRVPVQDLEALEHKAWRKRDNSDDVSPGEHEVSNGIFTACDDVGEGWWYHWTPITVRNTRKDNLPPLYRRIRDKAKQLAHNTNSLHSGRLTIKLAQGGRDAGEVWITFQSAANTVPCEHGFTRDCLTPGNRVVRLLSAVRARRWLGRDPPWHRNQHARSPLMLGTKRKRLNRKYGSGGVAIFSERTWGFVHLLGEFSTVSRWLYANRYVVLARRPRQHACRVRSLSLQIRFPLASVPPEEVCHEHMPPPRIRDTLIVQLLLRGTCDHRIFHILFTHVHLLVPACLEMWTGNAAHSDSSQFATHAASPFPSPPSSHSPLLHNHPRVDVAQPILVSTYLLSVAYEREPWSHCHQ